MGHCGKSGEKERGREILESLYIAEPINSLVYLSGVCLSLCNDSATEVFDDEISQ